MEFEKIRQNRILRIVLIVLDLLSLLCVGYGKSKVSHPGGTVIDQAFLETVRKIVVHERFAQYGTICAICFLITTMLLILPDYAELNIHKAKWGAVVCGLSGLVVLGIMITRVGPIMFDPVTVAYENEISEERQSERNDKTPLVNSSDATVRKMEDETRTTGSYRPYYMVYCNGQILRMYDIHDYTLGDDVK